MNFARARLKQVREMRRKNPKATRKSIYGTNLFGMMLEAYEEGNSNMTKSQLLDQCKTMLIASDSPTSLLMIWTLTLLAMHPDWQERLRSEVQDVLPPCTWLWRNCIMAQKMVCNSASKMSPPKLQNSMCNSSTLELSAPKLQILVCNSSA
jgi:cytochrome P450